MTISKLLILAALVPLALVPAVTALDRPVAQPVDAHAGAFAATAAALFAHADCVGPALPGTTGPHATHTTHATGFVIDPSRPIHFSASTFTISGAGGACPETATPLGYLPQDFTGSWTLTAVCAEGTITPGQTAVAWQITALAGQVTGQLFGGNGCTGYLNSVFAMDVTIAISGTQLLGVPLPATGGISTQVSQ